MLASMAAQARAYSARKNPLQAKNRDQLELGKHHQKYGDLVIKFRESAWTYQDRLKASIMGADAVINSMCSKEGTSLLKNCWASSTCEASAIRVNNTDNSAD